MDGQIWALGRAFVFSERGEGVGVVPDPSTPGGKTWREALETFNGFFSKKCLKIVFSVFFPSNLTKMETHRFSGTKCQVRENFGSRPPERGGQPPVQN